VGGDYIHLVPIISTVGGDASHRSHWVAVPMSLIESVSTVEPRPSVLNATLPASAADRDALSIDICCYRRPPGFQQQTRRPSLLLSTDWTDGRMDGHRTVTYTLPRILCGQHQ